MVMRSPRWTNKTTKDNTLSWASSYLPPALLPTVYELYTGRLRLASTCTMRELRWICPLGLPSRRIDVLVNSKLTEQTKWQHRRTGAVPSASGIGGRFSPSGFCRTTSHWNGLSQRVGVQGYKPTPTSTTVGLQASNSALLASDDDQCLMLQACDKLGCVCPGLWCSSSAVLWRRRFYWRRRRGKPTKRVECYRKHNVERRSFCRKSNDLCGMCDSSTWRRI